MRWKPVLIFSISVVLISALAAYSSDYRMMKHGNHHESHDVGSDNRTKLNTSEKMKEHQLQNMREHLEAVQKIILSLSTEDYDSASKIAREKLGLTEKMKKMCSAIGNDEFGEMGFAFHRSADDLGETLKTKDMKKSLAAMQNMLQNCVNCHATFKL